MSATPFITIEPQDPRYRQFLAAAIKANDKAALAALRGNTTKPIHFVTNWFYYNLMQGDHERPDVIQIFSPQTRLDYAKLVSHDQKPLDIAMDTYNFLMH